MWEVPCISGQNGSGTVFFSGCNLGCIFCQNHNIATARLERELGPHPRISVLRSHWPRIAAAAAAVLIFLGGGGYLLHENRDLGDKGFVIATATDSGSSAADMAQVDGTPAGDGEGTLAGALRAAVPTEEAVRAAALPGEEPGAGTAPGIAPGRNALAAADMRGFEDGRAAALTSGAAPAGEAGCCKRRHR